MKSVKKFVGFVFRKNLSSILYKGINNREFLEIRFLDLFH